MGETVSPSLENELCSLRSVAESEKDSLAHPILKKGLHLLCECGFCGSTAETGSAAISSHKGPESHQIFGALCAHRWRKIISCPVPLFPKKSPNTILSFSLNRFAS